MFDNTVIDMAILTTTIIVTTGVLSASGYVLMKRKKSKEARIAIATQQDDIMDILNPNKSTIPPPIKLETKPKLIFEDGMDPHVEEDETYATLEAKEQRPLEEAFKAEPMECMYDKAPLEEAGSDDREKEAMQVEPEQQLPLAMVEHKKIREINEQISNPDLQGLITDRLEDIENHTHPDDKALASVDFVDELQNLLNEENTGEELNLMTIIGLLRRELESDGYEFLDSDTWEPSIQRAVKIDYTLPEEGAPVIACKRATGLSKGGNLIRKQEVELLRHL